MKFSLRNTLVVISFLAILLGYILSDEDVKLKGRAVRLQQELELIERAKEFNQPLAAAELEKAIRANLTMQVSR